MANPNITELLKLAEALRAGAPVSVMPEIQPGTIQTDDFPDLLNMRFDNSDPGRYTPDILSPEGKYIRDALNINRDTQPLRVENPNAPKPPQSMQPRSTPQTYNPAYEKPADAGNTTTTAPQGDMQSDYENYLKLFEKTLSAKPELDTKRRNQLAMVAGINALGQALKQVVDFTGREKFGSPIIPQQDQLTPALLGQYEKEYQDYLQRKDRYDLQRTNTMQQALQYAYGDEKAREQYEKQLDLLGRQQDFSREQAGVQAEENAKERQARAELYGKQAQQQAERDKTQHGYDLEKLKKNFEYESALVAQRGDEALKAVKERYGFQAATKVATELAKKSLLVTDENPNKPITIPPQIYMDVLQKQIALQNQDFTEFLTSTDFNATNNAGDIMVARYWKDFYTPVYDANGDVISWESKGAKYEQQPQAMPAGDGTPTWFQ